MYEDTRLGRQEIYAEFLETTEGVWFANFDPARHVSLEAEYHPAYFVRCAIDAGTSRHTAAVFFQVPQPSGLDRAAGDGLRRLPRRRRGEPEERARDQGDGRTAAVPWPDSTRCGSTRRRRRGRRWGRRRMASTSECSARESSARWPQHLVLDGLDMMELLLDAGDLVIHPRCVRLKEAFGNYCRQRGGEWIDFPADGHPEEDMIDATRGGIRDAMPSAWCPARRSARSVHRGFCDRSGGLAQDQMRSLRPKIMTMERSPGWKDDSPPITREACAAAAEFAEAALQAHDGLPIPEVSTVPHRWCHSFMVVRWNWIPCSNLQQIRRRLFSARRPRLPGADRDRASRRRSHEDCVSRQTRLRSCRSLRPRARLGDGSARRQGRETLPQRVRV